MDYKNRREILRLVVKNIRNHEVNAKKRAESRCSARESDADWGNGIKWKNEDRVANNEFKKDIKGTLKHYPQLHDGIIVYHRRYRLYKDVYNFTAKAFVEYNKYLNKKNRYDANLNLLNKKYKN